MNLQVACHGTPTDTDCEKALEVDQGKKYPGRQCRISAAHKSIMR
jgi:hypothetical protein